MFAINDGILLALLPYPNILFNKYILWYIVMVIWELSGSLLAIQWVSFVQRKFIWQIIFTDGSLILVFLAFPRTPLSKDITLSYTSSQGWFSFSFKIFNYFFLIFRESGIFLIGLLKRDLTRPSFKQDCIRLFKSRVVLSQLSIRFAFFRYDFTV